MVYRCLSSRAYNFTEYNFTFAEDVDVAEGGKLIPWQVYPSVAIPFIYSKSASKNPVGKALKSSLVVVSFTRNLPAEKCTFYVERASFKTFLVFNSIFLSSGNEGGSQHYCNHTWKKRLLKRYRHHPKIWKIRENPLPEPREYGPSLRFSDIRLEPGSAPFLDLHLEPFDS